MTRFAVHRPVSTLMACLIVVLLGWVALERLAIDLMPDITYPTISVGTVYEGAGPEEMETLITRPMERTLSSVAGVEELSSETNEGNSWVRVRFDWGTNLDAAIGDIRAKIERIRDNLPEGIDPPTIERYDIADFPIMYIGMSSDLDPIAMTRLAERDILPRLDQCDGVASVRIRGGVRREIQIDLDRRKLEALNMSVNEVVAVLQRENINQPAGDFEEGNLKLLIRSRGEYINVEQIGETIVREVEDAAVRIRDIARVVDGEEERTELTRVNGEAGLMFYINKQAGANTVAVSDNVQQAVAELNNSLTDAQLTIRTDKSEFIRDAIANIRSAALYGMTLAIIVLILFLGSFRSTLVIGISIPLAVLATFVLIYFKGFTLNIVSFGGLALGIGLLVDNSIVVLESIFRKRDEGLDPKTAAIEGTQEVASAIIASTATTLIVFLPLLFIEGTAGLMLHQMAWVVSFALFCSLLASLTLTPVLTAYWIAPPQVEATSRNPLRKLVRGFHSLNRGILELAEGGYRRVLAFTFRHAGIVGFVLLLGACATFGLIPRIGTEFMPATDEGDLRIIARMAPGIRLETLDRQARIIEQAIFDKIGDDALATGSFIGGDKDDSEDWNEAMFRITLKPRSQRSRSVEDIRKSVEDEVGILAGMDVRVRVAGEMLSSRMMGNSEDSSLFVEVRGHDQQIGEELANQVAERMRGIEGLVNVQAWIEDRRPELTASVDRAKASLLGVSVSDVAQVLETTIRGTPATIYREEGDEFNVLVRLREQDRQRMFDVQQVGVATPTGRIVPLKNLVDFTPSQSPVNINRLDRQRVLYVSADVEDRDLGGAVADLQQEINTLPRPEGFSYRIAGDWKNQQESFEALQQGFILALILMYMVMASQFESLRDPLLILVAVPLGGVGVILMLLATGTTFNVQSFIGTVILAGIVVNNAIVLVDYINQLRRSQAEARIDDVIVQAAVRRFRPILMTTLTTVLAMTPIALGWGEGGELQAPMARVVIGGLISGTLITLLAIPLIYRVAAKAPAST